MSEAPVNAPVEPATPAPVVAPAADPAPVAPAAVTPPVADPVAPAPVDPAAPKPSGTIADPIDDKTIEGDPPADDWRVKLAGEDKAFLAHLKRYKTLENYAKAGFEAQQRIRAGEAKKPLPDNATAEEIAEYREANGIPADAKGYVAKVDLPSGVVIGEADKPLVVDFAAYAHAKNWPQGQFNEAMGWYYDFQEKQLADQSVKDDETWAMTRDELRDEWGGPDFRRNQNAINNFISTLPDGIGERLLTARDANGRKLGADPAVLRWMASIANEANPAAALLPPGTTQPLKAVETEISEIKAMMADDRSEYYQGPKAAGLQARYRELIDAQSKMARPA